jgi:hypothetical protein
MCFFFYSRVALADPLVLRERPFCDERRRRAGGEEEFENSGGFFPKDTKTQRDQTLFLRDVTKKNRAERQKQLLLLLLRSEPTKTRARVCVERTARARFSLECVVFFSKKKGGKS